MTTVKVSIPLKSKKTTLKRPPPSADYKTIRISVSIPVEVLKLVDLQGPDRSTTLTHILVNYLEDKNKNELKKAYIDYAKAFADDEDTADWERTAVHDLGKRV